MPLLNLVHVGYIVHHFGCLQALVMMHVRCAMPFYDM